MGKPRSLILPVSVDRALKRHSCQHSGKHVILKGDLRLKVANGRSHDHYCSECAKKFVGLSIERLTEIAAEFDKTQPAGAGEFKKDPPRTA